MRILNLKSENVKGIKVIDITPKEDMVIISGKNGAGKTSALDCLWYAVEWRAGAKGTPMPIRKGEKKAEVRLTLCEDLTEEQKEQGVKPKVLFIVNRKWTSNNKTKLKVTNGEGLVYETPQELLDGFIGYLSFEPRLFTRMSGKEQRDLLIKITGFDVTRIELKIVELREKRRLQGQTVKLLSGEREEIDNAGIPEEEISIINLNIDLEKAINHNQEIETTKNKIDRFGTSIINYESRIKDLEEDIKNTKKAIEEDKSKKDAGEKYLSEHETIDTENIKTKIEKAIEINELIKARERNKEADIKQKKAQDVYNEYTKGIEANLTEIEEGLKKSWAKIPDQKLSLTEDGIAYDGTPYSQIAFSEQLKVAIKIDIALNPILKVIRIADYSLLDEESKATVRKIAKEENYQVWGETVDDSGQVGFYMEEGEVIKVDGEKVSQPEPSKGIEGKEEKGKMKGEPKDSKRIQELKNLQLLPKNYESRPKEEE